MHHTTKTDATRYYTSIITAKWQYVLKIWESRKIQELDCFPPNILSDIQGIHALKDQLNQKAKSKILKLKQIELLIKP